MGRLHKNLLSWLEPPGGAARLFEDMWMFRGGGSLSCCPVRSASRVCERERPRLWMRYFALGGMSSALDVEAILCGALVSIVHDRDVIAVALDECYAELGGDHQFLTLTTTTRSGHDLAKSWVCVRQSAAALRLGAPGPPGSDGDCVERRL